MKREKRDEIEKSAISKLFVSLRNEMGLTQEQMSEKFNLVLRHYIRYETGQVNSTDRVLQRLYEIKWGLEVKNSSIIRILTKIFDIRFKNFGLMVTNFKHYLVFTVATPKKYQFFKTNFINPFLKDDFNKIMILEKKNLTTEQYLEIYNSSGVFDHKSVIEEIFNKSSWEEWKRLLGKLYK